MASEDNLVDDLSGNNNESGHGHDYEDLPLPEFNLEADVPDFCLYETDLADATKSELLLILTPYNYKYTRL